MNLIAYTRVSTVEQGESGLGLEAQRAQIEAAATARGAIVVGWFEDVQSGGDTERPGLRDALNALDRADGLIAAKLDRLSRGVVHTGQIMAELNGRRKTLIVLDLGVDTSTPMGEFFAFVTAAYAQLERRMIGERTKAALAAKAARGEQVGRAPEISQHLEDTILEMRETGLSFAEICDWLKQYPTARGGAWSTSTIHAAAMRALRRRAQMANNTEGSNDSDG